MFWKLLTERGRNQVVLDTLVDARRTISRRENWVQGSLHVPATPWFPDAPEQFCMIGAVNHVSRTAKPVRRLLRRRAMIMLANYGLGKQRPSSPMARSAIAHFNDAGIMRSVHHQSVLGAFDRAIDGVGQALLYQQAEDAEIGLQGVEAHLASEDELVVAGD